VVLDADLSSDCECVISRIPTRTNLLKMGSLNRIWLDAGGLHARLAPVVNSFASFLPRANEQIYNNASEKSRIIMPCITPVSFLRVRKSHQSCETFPFLPHYQTVLLATAPQAEETRMVVEYSVEQAQETWHCAYPRASRADPLQRYSTPQGCALTRERHARVRVRPVMLHEALSPRIAGRA